MQTVGFNFTKIEAHKLVKMQNVSPNMIISFTNIEKENSDLITSKILKISFSYKITYTDNTEKSKNKEIKENYLLIEGNFALTVSEEEEKEFLKEWKKKETPTQYRESLYNLILRKCTLKAVSLEEEVNLPIHIPIPKVKI